MTTGRINQGARVLRAETRAPIIVRGDRLGARGYPGAGRTLYIHDDDRREFLHSRGLACFLSSRAGHYISLDIFGKPLLWLSPDIL